MRGKTMLLLFVLLLGGMACSKKQTESSQTTQTPSTQTPAAQTPTASPSQQVSATPAEPAEPATPQAQSAPATQSAASASAAAVPTGTTLVVQLNNAVSSKTARAGEPFTGTVAKPVVVDGETLIPRGAAVTGIVTNVKAAGKLAGAAQMGLKLTSISVRGESYKVRSNEISQTSTGKGKRTAVLGGGGAGLGAIVGGLAGGKKGALVGGLAGGGAGTAGSAFTGNADVALPAESLLSFRLSQSLDLSQPTLSSSK